MDQDNIDKLPTEVKSKEQNLGGGGRGWGDVKTSIRQKTLEAHNAHYKTGCYQWDHWCRPLISKVLI